MTGMNKSKEMNEQGESLFDDFDFTNTLKDLMDQILPESPRGAVLVGFNFIDERLDEFMEAHLPQKDKEIKRKLFSFPGIYSSFSGKLIVAYSTRMISKDLYESLDLFRKIRNKAAHSGGNFNLGEIEDKLYEVYNIVPGAANAIRHQGVNLMMSFKKLQMEGLATEHEIEYEQVVSYMEDWINQDGIQELGKQAHHWALVMGILHLLAFISFEQRKNLEKLDGSKPWRFSI